MVIQIRNTSGEGGPGSDSPRQTQSSAGLADLLARAGGPARLSTAPANAGPSETAGGAGLSASYLVLQTHGEHLRV